jgi:mannose-6-phosphate isomerase-like protein (cupin superfamily)
MGIPLHRHPFPEFFYVLEGNLSMEYWNNQGVTEWDACEAGESLVVQPNAPHTFFNKSEHPCRTLSVSTYHHERMMKDAVHPEGRTDFLPAQLTQADFQKLTKSMEKNQAFLVADHA